MVFLGFGVGVMRGFIVFRIFVYIAVVVGGGAMVERGIGRTLGGEGGVSRFELI